MLHFKFLDTPSTHEFETAKISWSHKNCRLLEKMKRTLGTWKVSRKINKEYKIGHTIFGWYLATKQQISWVVSLWQSPLTFVWPGVPKDCWLKLIVAPSDVDWNAIWRYVPCIDEIVPSYVFVQLNSNFQITVTIQYTLAGALPEKGWR